MKRWMKLFGAMFVVLALTAAAGSAALAAPQNQSVSSSVDLSAGFAFDIYNHGVLAGTLTVASGGSWVTTDPQGAQISQGTMTSSTSGRGATSRVAIDAVQASGGTAHLVLYFVGSPKAAVVVGGMTWKTDTDHGFTFISGLMTPKTSALSISGDAPVMLLGTTP